jgi:hypothetical protein
VVRTLMNSLQLVFDAEKTLRYIILENIYHVWKHSSLNFATNLMNRARAAKTTILLITTLVLTVITSIQPVFAPNTCRRFIAQFEKLIESFMSDTLRLIPPDPISPFVKLTIPFDKDVTKAACAGHASSPDDPLILNGCSILCYPTGYFQYCKLMNLTYSKYFFDTSTAISFRYSVSYASHLDLRKYILQVSVCTRDRPSLDHSYIFP